MIATPWKVPGEFVPCDVNLARDPKIMRAGPMAELLFRRGNEYAKANDRDGDLYEVELPMIAFGIKNPAKEAATLVRVGLWEPIEGGWQIRSYLKWNMTRDQVAAARQRKRENALRSNHKQGQHDDEPREGCPLCTA